MKSKIGQHSKIYGKIDDTRGEWVTIGERVVVGSQAMILTHGPIRPFKKDPTIVIEDLTWVGFRAIILPGVKIGRCSIIGAGAVVVSDVPAYSIYAGNPAKFIRYREVKEILRSFIIKWLMNKRLGYESKVKWELLTYDHIKYIFPDGRFDNFRLVDIVNYGAVK